MQLIPVTNDGARRVTVDLQNGLGVYTFQTYFNSVLNRWVMDILDSNDNPLYVGATLNSNIDVLRAQANIQELIGEFRLSDTACTSTINSESLGVSNFLMHFLPGEFQTLVPPDPDAIPPINIDLGNVLQI